MLAKGLKSPVFVPDYGRSQVRDSILPVVLVSHSYGGSIITEAGNDPNIAALVYIAAFALDEGESLASIETAAASLQGIQAG